MDNLLTITFEAHCEERNHHRRYQITVGHDLLDDWTVRLLYGRCGKCCQEKHFASPQADEMRSLIRRSLSRRLSAPKRIGCAYRLSAFDIAPGFDRSTWIPNDILERFLTF